VNCETVAESPISVFLDLPVAAWGLFGYAFMAGLCIWGLRRRQRSPTWPFGALFWLSVFTAVLGITLFAVSHFVIRSVCIVCGGTYLVNVALLIVAVVDLRRHGSGPWQATREELAALLAAPRPVLIYGGVFAALLVAAWFGTPRYWQVVATMGPGGINVGRTEEGHPWIGATKPSLEIIEYSDYQCPHCLRGHDDLRKVISEHPGKVRLVHRHYPLDQSCNPIVKRPFHPFACEYSRMAYCAGEQGKFWEANDYIFAQGRRREPLSTQELAEQVALDPEALAACVTGDAAKRAIDADMAEGRELKIRGTPSFVIGDRTYPGRIPPDVLQKALGEMGVGD
jgi:protein-disulfide isomerase/uncharacterized membrane protein